MKIGLIIYSQTGHTRAVAEKLKEKLSLNGHDASIDEITIKGKIPAQLNQFTLEKIPDPSNYDALILASPVQAFSLNPVMKAYLGRLPELEGKKIAIVITKQLPLLVTGGTGAVAHVRGVCKEKGGVVVGSEIVVWSEKKRQESIERCVRNISALF